jgi:hypothetical protein
VFIPGSLAGRLLGTHPGRVKDLSAEGRIRARRIGGGAPQFCLADVLTVAAEAESAGAPEGNARA